MGAAQRMTLPAGLSKGVNAIVSSILAATAVFAS